MKKIRRAVITAFILCLVFSQGVFAKGAYIDKDSIYISTKIIHQNEKFTMSFQLQEGSAVYDGESLIILRLDNGVKDDFVFYFPIHYDAVSKKYTGTGSLGGWGEGNEEAEVSVSSISLYNKDNSLRNTILNTGGALSGFDFHYTKALYPFQDIAPGAWYQNAVDFVNYHKLMTGLTPDTFSPASTLSRAQFATILYRMEKSPEVEYTTKFPDVLDGEFYTSAVLWASSEGIITGYEDGRFGPADTITREQMAVMMFRYARYKNYDNTDIADLTGFPDYSAVSTFALEAMGWANFNGLVTGDNGKLNPQGEAARAVCAAVIMRFMNAYE